LIKLLGAWRKEHGKVPETEEDKKKFVESVFALGRGFSTSDNFREALNYKYLTWLQYEIPYETQEIFDDEKCENINESSPRFWLLARAVRNFVQNEGNGHLPLVGTLPDITAKPDAYIAKQKLFRQKAEADIQAVKVHLQVLLKSINKSPDDIRDEDIALFCKHSSVMKVFRFTPVQNEYDSSKIQKENIEWYDENGKWYLAFRAAGKFQGEHGRLPGDRNDDPQADFANLHKVALHLLEELEMDPAEVDLDNFLKEVCRFGGCQIHNTAAFIGGVASQEIIKLVTKQWHPVDNTYIYNGITGTSAFFQV
jgi:amyloid beta precursor protein binding protein 1